VWWWDWELIRHMFRIFMSIVVALLMVGALLVGVYVTVGTLVFLGQDGYDAIKKKRRKVLPHGRNHHDRDRQG